jgi:hypothetical protein
MKAQPNNHPVKKYPVIGACGLDCGLCPAFHRDGKSRCPGCCGEGFWEGHPGCGFITCCVKQKGLDTCGECNEFEFCPRVMKLLQQAKRADSLLSYLTVEANFEYVRKNGIKKWDSQQQEKIAFLKSLLENYNDGRSKSFLCLSVQLLPLNKLKAALAASQDKMTPDVVLKEKAKIVKDGFTGVAEKCGVELKLRKGK